VDGSAGVSKFTLESTDASVLATWHPLQTITMGRRIAVAREIGWRTVHGSFRKRWVLDVLRIHVFVQTDVCVTRCFPIRTGVENGG